MQVTLNCLIKATLLSAKLEIKKQYSARKQKRSGAVRQFP